jgi:hypothetical protein
MLEERNLLFEKVFTNFMDWFMFALVEEVHPFSVFCNCFVTQFTIDKILLNSIITQS